MGKCLTQDDLQASKLAAMQQHGDGIGSSTSNMSVGALMSRAWRRTPQTPLRQQTAAAAGFRWSARTDRSARSAEATVGKYMVKAWVRMGRLAID
jgi:hypothetical protein